MKLEAIKNGSIANIISGQPLIIKVQLYLGKVEIKPSLEDGSEFRRAIQREE